MLVTQTTLVGYTIINGTFSLQLAMLIGCLYNYFTYPNPLNDPYFADIGWSIP